MKKIACIALLFAVSVFASQKQLASPVCIRISSLETCNVFSGRKPTLVFEADSKLKGKGEVQLTVVARDLQGTTVFQTGKKLKHAKQMKEEVFLDLSTFGVFNVEFTLVAAKKRYAQAVRVGYFPKYHELTQEEKLRSPYGLNVHGGRDAVIYPFKYAGITWFRDYAFNKKHQAMTKKGPGDYSGEFNYHRLVEAYDKAGILVDACMQYTIDPLPVEKAKRREWQTPSAKWKEDLEDLVKTFPSIRYWEIDNEYDLDERHCEAEIPSGWTNYKIYHREFASIVTRNGAVAVENGRAGIWPDRVADCVKSGYFKDVGVINSHHYTGTEPPEVNYGNFNTAFDAPHRAQDPMLFFDRLREAKRVSSIDGKKRESWITEIGWDNRAGFVVSEFQQAAYLARCYMMCLAAGTEKAFWFFDTDSKGPARNYFDGCGLLDSQLQPKLALASMAGLTHVLKLPEFVGIVHPNDGAWGYLFKDQGRFVVSVWNIFEGEGKDISFQAEKLYDMYGNALEGKRARLSQAPVYAAGLSKEDPLFKQSAYMLKSPYLVVNSSGDTVQAVLQVRNERDSDIVSTMELELPEGWTAVSLPQKISVRKGNAAPFGFSFRIKPTERLGEQRVFVVMKESGAEVVRIPLRILVKPALDLQVSKLTNAPGPADVVVKLRNDSVEQMKGTLKISLPSGWKTGMGQVRVEKIASKEILEKKISLEWNPEIKLDEKAVVEFISDDGRKADASIIPPAWKIGKIEAPKMDGMFDGTRERNALPAWMIGSTIPPAQADLRMGWSEKGIYLAMEVNDSTVSISDPRSFWNGDCLELFLSTSDDKGSRAFKEGDHQFWFVPQPETGTVYVGQWKRGSEIPATRYDVKTVRTYSKKTAAGYMMEMFIPVEEMRNYVGQPGKRIRVGLTGTVQGRQFKREIFWPYSKLTTPLGDPKNLGTVLLEE